MDLNVHFISLFRSPVSWAKVGRELAAALARSGAHVSAVSLKGFLHDEAFPLPPEVEEALGRERRPGWDLALDYPPNFSRLDGARRAGILIYEAERFPEHWARAAGGHLDLALVPSHFCREAAERSGLPAAKLRVAPFGVNEKVYRPCGPAAELPTGRAFNFLAVAAPHVRKGLAELTEAFRRAFGARDDVGLVVKCPPLSSLSGRPWEYPGADAFLGDTRGGQISLLDRNLSEEEMAELYRGADVLVQPGWGESFGLAPLEAAVCARPSVATRCGGLLEYLDEENAWLVDTESVDARRAAYDWPGGPVRMWRPKAAELAEALRLATRDGAARRRKGAAALETARGFTWERSAEAVIEALRGAPG